MSNEIKVRASLAVNNPAQNLRYQNQPQGFSANMLGSAGPTPGDLLVSTAGTQVNFSQLTIMGGWCRIANKDLINYVEIGIEANNIFYPLLELLPGEQIVIRLSRHIQQEAVGTGTYAGTTSLLLRAEGAPVRVVVEAFDA